MKAINISIGASGSKNANNSHYYDDTSHPVPSHYQGLERNPQMQNPNPVYEELSQDPAYESAIGNDGKKQLRLYYQIISRRGLHSDLN